MAKFELSKVGAGGDEGPDATLWPLEDTPQCCAGCGFLLSVQIAVIFLVGFMEADEKGKTPAEAFKGAKVRVEVIPTPLHINTNVGTT